MGKEKRGKNKDRRFVYEFCKFFSPQMPRKKQSAPHFLYFFLFVALIIDI